MERRIAKRSKRKNIYDVISRVILFSLSNLALIALIAMFAIIVKESVPAYEKFGFFHMYFSSDFTEAGGFGIWGPLTVTLFSAILATIIATPISLRAAIFIHYRITHGKRAVNTVITALAGVPSVVFGIFALNSLKGLTNLFLGGESAQTFLNGTFMLVIMIFPTLVSLILNQLKLVDKAQLNSAIALGNTKTRGIYRVIKKTIRPGIQVAIIVALGRAIGETMALSMIFASSPASNPFSGGFSSFFASPQTSLGVSIARNMFTDSQNITNRSALLAAGVALFIITMTLIFLVTTLSKKQRIDVQNPFTRKMEKSQYRSEALFYLAAGWHWILTPFKALLFAYFEISKYVLKTQLAIRRFLFYPFRKIFFPKKTGDNTQYYTAVARHKLARTGDVIRLSLEVMSFSLIIAMTSWIVVDVFSVGLPAWSGNDWMFTYTDQGVIGPVIRKGVIGNTLVFSLVLVAITLVIAAPFAFATAIYLSEYARPRGRGKITKFFLDSLNGTPSILFGIFGLIVFVQLANIGRINNSFSMIAGVLTMTLVVLPTFTRSIEQTLAVIPQSIRDASYALGASKSTTILRVVLPQAIPGIVSGLILSAGRILGETAPVYLTIGMLGNINVDMLEQGWTMTTKIFYNQIYSVGNAHEIMRESYEIASASIILITLLIILADLTPLLINKIKERFTASSNKRIIANNRVAEFNNAIKINHDKIKNAGVISE